MLYDSRRLIRETRLIIYNIILTNTTFGMITERELLDFDVVCCSVLRSSAAGSEY